ncbi:MAG TPA: AraC family transcriptional regulator, partial [Streptomyces sp.]
MPKKNGKNGTTGENAAPPAPEPLRVPVADSHTHLDMQSTTVSKALAQAA